MAILKFASLLLLITQCLPTSATTTVTTKVKTTSKATSTVYTTSSFKTSAKTTTPVYTPPTSSSETPTVTTTTSASATPSTNAEWAQCGGIGFTGGHLCPVNWVCTYQNEYHSQCLPGPNYTTSSRTTTASTTTSSAGPAPTPLKYFFSFGDDYTKTGFDIKGTKPSSDNRLGNPPYPGLTTSGGENWISRLSLDDYNMLFYNLASGGATTDATLVPPSIPKALSFVDQVSLFINNQQSYADWTSNNSAFAIWIGINDVSQAFSLPGWPQLSQKIADKYFEQVERLYAAGARKFVFLTIPPLQRTPLMLSKSQSVRDSETAAIATFNSLLTTGKAALETKHPLVQTQLVDTAEQFNFALDNPWFFGLPDATCINTDGVSCYWTDQSHPGQQIQVNIAFEVDYQIIGLGRTN